MNLRTRARRLLVTTASLVFLLCATNLPAQTDGIYADFITSLGNFTCRLEYTNAPKAVANFIGLATGGRAWLEEPTGQVKTNAFYNGLTFHRVISGFMIQGGSPNGAGTDGPGYAFEDEFTPTLRFDAAGVLASANSGPDSNGSQYFITVAAQPHLNDVHTIFGRVTSGQTVVNTISKVAVNASSKPLTNVIVQSIQIRRVGTQAQNFNLHGQSLPVVTNTPVRLAPNGSITTLSFTNNLHTDTRLYSSTNLVQWSGTKLGIDTALPVATNVSISPTGACKFFRIAQVRYPSAVLVPKSLSGRTLVLRFDGGNGTNTTVFNNSGGGTYTWPTLRATNTVASYTWDQDAYRARLYPITWNLWYPFYLRLDFLTTTNGKFSGQQDFSGVAVSGTFNLSP